jgi:hypothetical protein
VHIDIRGFVGLTPKLDARLLPQNAAQTAVGTKINNGTVRAWNEPYLTASLPKVGTIKSIYRFGQQVGGDSLYWFHWLTDVDVVRGPVADEAAERTYWTGDGQPKYTYFPMAVQGGSNYPVAWYRLGIPAPLTPVSLSIGDLPAQDAVETTKEAQVNSITRTSATVATVTLAEDPKFDITKPTKVTVFNATPSQYNGTYDATWVTPSVLTYSPSKPVDSGGTQITSKTISVASISRYDATTVEVTLSEDSPFLTTESAKVTVSGANLAIYNGTHDVIPVSARVLRYKPDGSTVSTSLYVKPTRGSSEPFTLSRVDNFTININLADPVRYDTSKGAKISITDIDDDGTVWQYNGTYDAVWLDDHTLQYKTTVAIPAVPAVGDQGDITLNITGQVLPDIPSTPTPDGVSSVLIKGTVSTELPNGTAVTGASSVFLAGMAVPEDNRDREARSYVVTYVSPLGEEGPPSPASSLVEVVNGQEVQLTAIPTAPSGDWNLPSGTSKKRIYRTATSGNAAVYLFLTELPITTTTYLDDKGAEVLGEALPSEYWNPPPEDLKGLTVLANGIMAGFRNNEVWFSEPFLPHAWPSRNMQKTDYDVVGIGAFGASLFVGTKGAPHIFSGIDPAQMTGTKFDLGQACVSKLSVVEMGGGVIFASPDGLCMADGNGVNLLTGQLIDRAKWQLRHPATMSGAAHDGRYFAFCDDGKALVLDLSGDGATMWEAGLSVTATYTDPINDAMYYVNAQRQLLKWDGGSTPSPFVWRSKIFEVPAPVSFGVAQVLCDAYPITFVVAADGTIAGASYPQWMYSKTVVSSEPFRLPGGFRARYWSVGVEGVGAVSSIQIATSMEELARG